MKEKIKRAWALIRKAPLLFLVPASALLLSLIAYTDPVGVWAGYSPKSSLEPLFVRLMTEEGEDEMPAKLSGEMAGPGYDGSEDLVDWAPAETTEAAAAKESAEMPKEDSTVAVQKVAAGDGSGQDVDPSDDEATVSGNEEGGKAPKFNKGNEEEGALEEESVQEEEMALEPELDLTIPQESTCQVCSAKDYGLANPAYMAPEGWEPVEDTTGFFSTNGYYRTLHEVDKEYFSDALFIGDSRVDGLCDYGGLSEYATFLCKDSLTVYKLFSEVMRYKDPYGGKGYKSLMEVLEGRHFHKIYLQIGVNELGTGSTADFYEAYRNAVATIKTKQPTALIYIEGIMHVTAAKSSSDSVFTNSLVVDKNRAISTLANGRDIFYLDPNPAVCDENGNLRSDLSMDHAHLKAKAHIYWTEFLMQKAADPNEPAAPVYLK